MFQYLPNPVYYNNTIKIYNALRFTIQDSYFKLDNNHKFTGFEFRSSVQINNNII